MSQFLRTIGLGQSEVGNPNGAGGIEQQIRWLDIAMHHPLAMSMVEPFSHLGPKIGHAAVIAGRVGHRRKVGANRSCWFPMDAAILALQSEFACAIGPLELSQFIDHLIQAAPLNELHGVEMNAFYGSHAKN